MHIFDAKKLQRLDDPERVKQIPVKKIVSLLALKDGMSVADIGCGSGYFSFAFLEYVRPHGSLTGFDVQQASIDHCNAKKTARDTDIYFILSMPDKLPAQDKSFDAAVMIVVAHEAAKPEQFFKEVKRVLKPGAKLSIIEWQFARTKDGPELSERLAPDKLESFLKDAGFGVISDEISGENHYLIIAANS